MKKLPWKRISTEVAHSNPWFTIHHDRVIRPNGQTGDYYIMDRSDAVFTIAVTKKKKVLFISQFRYPVGKVSIELPAGSSDGQPPLRAAKRELLEETGYVAKKWSKLGTIDTANGWTTERCHYFVAQDLSFVGTEHQLEEGITSVLELSQRDIHELIAQKKIYTAHTIAGLYLYFTKRNNLSG